MGTSHVLHTDFIFGKSGAGRSLKFWGDTAGIYMLWNSDKLQLVGAGLSVGDDMEIAASKKIISLGTGATGLIMKNLKNAASSALSGAVMDVEMDIGGFAYYFPVYRVKA